MRGTWHRLFVTKSYLRGFCNLAQNDLALCEVPKNQFGAFGKEVFHVPVQPHFHGLCHEGSLQKLLAEGLEQKLLALQTTWRQVRISVVCDVLSSKGPSYTDCHILIILRHTRPCKPQSVSGMQRCAVASERRLEATRLYYTL